jgi:hypothetical protein
MSLDGFTSLSEEESGPSDGDISICAYCGNIGKYTNNVTMLQTLTDDELNKVMLESPEAYIQLQNMLEKSKDIRCRLNNLVENQSIRFKI